MDFQLRVSRRAQAFWAFVLIATVTLTFADDDTLSSDNPELEQLWRILETSTLSSHSDIEVKVREHAYPGGWKAPTHRHLGDLFIYVLEGDFEVFTETDGKIVYTVGDTFVMRPGVNMDARNYSDTEYLKILVFQVGKPDDPFLVLIE